MENKTFFFFHGLANQSQFLDNLIFFCAEILPVLVILGSIFFLFFHHDKWTSKRPFSQLEHKWREGLTIMLTGILAWMLVLLLKEIFQLPRPFQALMEINPLWLAEGYSLPSGHSAFFSALAVSILFYHKRAGYIFLLFAVLIGVARVMAGIHFPIDILIGFIFGVFVAFFVWFAKYARRV